MKSAELPNRILLVDDDRLMLRLLTDMLESAGFEIRSSSNCKRTLALFDEFEPDCVLCDWELPDAAGVDLVRHIRYVQQDRRPFIMMVSAHRSRNALELALSAGANDFLSKPVKKEELLARLAEAQRVRYLEKQLQILDDLGHLTVSHGYYSLYAS
ncbi:MAG: PleD family two-component system response regulator [Blastopirellula sp. JB062]